jgi:hypothetical protein
MFSDGKFQTINNTFLKVFFSRAHGGLVVRSQHYNVNHLTIQNIVNEFPYI